MADNSTGPDCASEGRVCGVNSTGRRKGPPRKDKAVCPAALGVLSHILLLPGGVGGQGDLHIAHGVSKH